MKFLLYGLTPLIPLAGLSGLICLGVALARWLKKSPQAAWRAGRWSAGSFVLAIGILVVVAVASQCQYMFLDEPLVGAAMKGDLAAVRRLVTRGADVNAEGDDGGGTALVAAASDGHTAIVEYLIKHGANVNQSCTQVDHNEASFPDWREVTPLQAASKHPEIVVILKTAGAR